MPGVARALAALTACSLLWVGEAPAQGQTVRAWLMPQEPAIDNPGATAERCEARDLASFDARYGKDRPINVLNAGDPGLRSSWDAINPEFATTNGAIVAGQCRTLGALERFAFSRSVRVDVQFVSWGQAFREVLRLARNRSGPGAPDLMQIGSTWLGSLAEDGVNAPAPPDLNAAEGWYSLPGKARVAIKYLTDHRLLFYWKRLPREAVEGPAVEIDDSSWRTIIGSLERQNGSAGVRPLATPVGLNVNLLYDYLPLVWAGGGSFLQQSWGGWFTRADLTSDRALDTPVYLGMADRGRQARSGDPLLVFPEMPHEEAAQHFLAGEYRAIVEPVAFVKRWYDAFAMQADVGTSESAPRRRSFWDYAAVAVPPSPFQGGSGLMVVNGSPNVGLAFDLARFLATDVEYARMLAEHGQLPAQNLAAGVEALAASLDGHAQRSDKQPREAFVRAVNRTVAASREAPALTAWSTALESTETLELVQRVWRRVGEGNEARIRASAAELEQAVNRHIFWPATIWASVEPALAVIAVALAVMAMVAIGALIIALRKSREVARSNRVRGFASIGLAKLETEHSFWHNEFSPSDPESEAGRKSALIMSVLRGWKRGADPSEWRDRSLHMIAWRAILLAIDSTRLPGLYDRWEEQSNDSADGEKIEDFLRTYQIPSISRPGLLRDEPAPNPQLPPFHFAVLCPSNVYVQNPFMLEQALACLIQNAITASRITAAMFNSIQIAYDPKAHAVSVTNQGKPFDDVIRQAMNPRVSLDRFKKSVATLLPTDDAQLPPRASRAGRSVDGAAAVNGGETNAVTLGIGLIEAYCIASECYRGLSIAAERPTVTIHL